VRARREKRRGEKGTEGCRRDERQRVGLYCTHIHTHAHTPTHTTQYTIHTAGFDYVPMTIEVTFPLHDMTSVTECRRVEVRDDIIVEGQESFFLLLSSQSDRVVLERNKTEIIIEDNDGMCTCVV